jgi:hypothetical protein
MCLGNKGGITVKSIPFGRTGLSLSPDQDLFFPHNTHQPISVRSMFSSEYENKREKNKTSHKGDKWKV